MYTKQQWIDMLRELDSHALLYEKFEETKERYWELEVKKEDIKDNTGEFVALILFGLDIFVFVKFGWLKGLIGFAAVCILDDIYDKLVVKKKVKKKLQKFEEKYGEEMKELEIEKENIEKQQSDMEASESYLACKSNLPIEYMGSRWYDSYSTNKRLKIRIALDNGAETLEKAVEIAQKSNSSD